MKYASPEHDRLTFMMGRHRFPKHATNAAILFLAENYRLVETRLALERSFNTLLLHSELIDACVNVGKYSHEKSEERVKLFVKYQNEIHREMIFCRLVDNFLTYLKDIVFLVTEVDRDAFRIGRKFDEKFITGFNSIEELADAIAREKTEKLASYRFDELLKVFDELGFKEVRTETAAAASKFLRLRNLVVHGRGLAAAQYRRGTEFVDDDGRLIVSQEDFDQAEEAFFEIIARNDVLVSRKWKLSLHDFSGLAEDLSR